MMPTMDYRVREHMTEEELVIAWAPRLLSHK
jgi:hypothetical protein